MEDQQRPDLDGSESSCSSGLASGLTGHQQSQSGVTETKEEAKVVGQVRIVVCTLLALTSLGFGAATYALTRKEELGDFETRFDDVAHELVTLSERELEGTVSAMKNLATTVTSHVVDSGSQWPQVLIPHLELQGMSLVEMARLQQLTIAPLVAVDHVNDWEDFAVQNQGWIQEGVDFRLGDEAPQVDEITSFVYRMDENTITRQTGPGVNGKYAPVWQQYPAPSYPISINFDLLSNPLFEMQFNKLATSDQAILSPVLEPDFLLKPESDTADLQQLSFLMHPLFANFTDQSQQAVGFLVGVISWKDVFSHQLTVESVSVVLQDECSNIFVTYELHGAEIVLIEMEDVHDSKFDHLRVSYQITSFLDDASRSAENAGCVYNVNIYPTDEFSDSFMSLKPLLYAVLAVLLFVFTTIVFGAYDFVVQKTQRDVIAKAERTNKLISDLFPRNVKDRLLGEQGYANTVVSNIEDNADTDRLIGSMHSRGGKWDSEHGGKSRSDGDSVTPYDTKPIADLFPNATIMFGDLVGFTAWASIREPTQVFTLLETLYHSFDVVAKKRRVFKVETVGDCYVAAAGLPDPRPDHALVMARFAKDCMKRMNELTKQLETTLGPDTGDLSMRIGLHSGPVTAGVLRGEKSRFQLFGDTVNTAARIEATGQRNMIHMSQDTADLLRKAGKGHWLKERADTVTPKGKGEMQTFWLDSDDSKQEKREVNESEGSAISLPPSEHDSSMLDDFSNCDIEEEFEKLGLKDLGVDSNDFDERTQSLVRWNAEILLKLLKQIVARRVAVEAHNKEAGIIETNDNEDPVLWPKSGLTPLEEVQEIIHLPEFDAFVAKHEPDPESIKIDEEVVGQLNDFVRIIASMYRSNPFHSFEHASHVAMSVKKLLSRIVAPSDLGLTSESVHNTDKSQKKSIKSSLHDYTFGITSDPLTQFSCVLSALVHDVDHTGVPNAQLVKEKAYIARVYNNKSVAEQNSVDSAWDLLMDVNFRALRNTICVSEDEQKRFRHLVVNSVLATDIVDKELKGLRNARWDRAFSDSASTCMESGRDRVNRKATIVIEHLIQASDIAHTMQHWHIYRKWNERLYQELLLAYKNGRSDIDPSDNWYKGEIGFFDFYIIPLAKKLKNCGVFGVSCDEYLNYALRNRQEWERKGQEIVASMVRKYRDGEDVKVGVQLDSIQDSDGAELRSTLMSSESLHEGSSHVARAVINLEADEMSIESSSPSLAVSVAKSFDGNRSMDCSRSLASNTETIFEEDEEESCSDEEFEGDDSFYSGGSNSDSEDLPIDGSNAKTPPPTDSDNQDDHINKLILTDSSKSLKGSKNKSLRHQLEGGKIQVHLIDTGKPRGGSKKSKPPRENAPQSCVTATSRDWGDDSAESSFASALVDAHLDVRQLSADADKTQASTKEQERQPRFARIVGKRALRKGSTGEDSLKGQSDRTCSVTQANTEWEQDSTGNEYYGSTPIDLICLQERINSRLVGSIKNTRAYDKKPSVEEMTFF